MGGSKKKQKGKQKPKPSKPKQNSAPKVENKGRFRYVCLKDELNARDLRIVTVSADGNCFFRSVSDQLTGHEKDHGKIREQVVQYMESHHDEFAPFVEDDESFEKYMKRMRKSTTWAGHMEVQATSMCFEKNIHIYQQRQPTWRVVNFQPADTSPCLHLSYHDGEHYNSVRCQSDSGGGPAEQISIVDSSCDGTADEGAMFGEKDVRQVSENTSCFDLDSIKDALATCGNVDDATEMIINRTGQRPAAEGVEQALAPDTEASRSDPVGEAAQGAPTGGPVSVHLKCMKTQKKVRVRFQVAATSSSEATQMGAGQPEPVLADAEQDSMLPRMRMEGSTGNLPGADAESSAAPGDTADKPAAVPTKPPVKSKGVPRIPKNKQCPCGGGRKFKNCCAKAGKEQPNVQPVVQGPSSTKGVITPATPKRLAAIEI